MLHVDTYIRPASRADTETLRSLWFALQQEHAALDFRYRLASDALQRYTNDVAHQIRARVVRILVAERGGDITGFVSARHWLPEPIFEQRLEIFLESLYVRPEFRREGIGTALVHDIRGWAIAEDAKRIRLGALSNNPTAFAFWTNVAAKSDMIGMTIELEDGPL